MMQVITRSSNDHELASLLHLTARLRVRDANGFRSYQCWYQCWESNHRHPDSQLDTIHSAIGALPDNGYAK